MGIETRQVYYLLFWYRPRVRSARSAEQVVSMPKEAFTPSPLLGLIVAEFGEDSRVEARLAPGRPADRLLMLAIDQGAIVDLGPQLAGRARELGLVMFDPQQHELVEPRRRSSASWPKTESHEVRMIRSIASEISGADDQGFERQIGQRFSILKPKEAFPAEAISPVGIPKSMRFTLPIAVPSSRQTKARLARLLVDLQAGSDGARRAAASELGGWMANPGIDAALETTVRSDPDPYVRAVGSLSLALRSDRHWGDIRDASVGVLASDGSNVWKGVAASISVLATAISAMRSGSRSACEEALVLTSRLGTTKGEELRAKDLGSMLADCVAGQILRS